MVEHFYISLPQYLMLIVMLLRIIEKTPAFFAVYCHKAKFSKSKSEYQAGPKKAFSAFIDRGLDGWFSYHKGMKGFFRG